MKDCDIEVILSVAELLNEFTAAYSLLSINLSGSSLGADAVANFGNLSLSFSLVRG